MINEINLEKKFLIILKRYYLVEKKIDLISLEDKTILVVGGSGLLGKEFLATAINQNAKVINVDLKTQSMNTDEITFNNSGFYEIACDITNENNVQKISYLIKEKFSKIDGLVNFASINPQPDEVQNSYLENMKLEQWKMDIDVALTGAFLIFKYIGYIISKNENGGSIISISSDLGIIAPDQRLYEVDEPNKRHGKKPISYSAVKFGIIGLSKYISTYWAHKNVRSNVICPGGVFNGQNIEFTEKVSQRIPLGRMARKDEFNSALVWLLSDSSSYVNGAVIPIDGGRTAW